MLNLKKENLRMLIAGTLSGLGVILIAISFSVSKTTKFVSSNTNYQDNNKQIEKPKEEYTYDNTDKEEILDNKDDEDNTNLEPEEDSSQEDKNEELDNTDEKEPVQEETQPEPPKEETMDKEENKDNNINNDTTNENNKDDTNETTIPEPTKKLTIYKNQDGYCKLQSETCNLIAYTIDTESEDAKILEFSENNNYMLYQDETLKLYNLATKEINKVKLTNTDLETYKFVINKDKLIGLIYKDKYTNYMGYYDFLNSSKMYENKYTTISTSDYEDYLIGTTIIDDKVNYALLNIKEEIVEIEDRTTNSCTLDFKIYTNNNQKIYIEKSSCPEDGIKNIYSNSKKIIVSGLENKNYYTIYNGNIYINDNNIIKKYDFDGNLLDNKKIGEFKQLIRNNVIYVDNNNLFLYDMNTKENIKFGEWNNSYLYNLEDSGYKISKNIDKINELIEDKVEDKGIYLVINYNEEKDGNKGIIYFYNRDKGVRIYNIKSK